MTTAITVATLYLAFGLGLLRVAALGDAARPLDQLRAAHAGMAGRAVSRGNWEAGQR